MSAAEKNPQTWVLCLVLPLGSCSYEICLRRTAREEPQVTIPLTPVGDHLKLAEESRQERRAETSGTPDITKQVPSLTTNHTSPLCKVLPRPAHAICYKSVFGTGSARPDAAAVSGDAESPLNRALLATASPTPSSSSSTPTSCSYIHAANVPQPPPAAWTGPMGNCGLWAKRSCVSGGLHWFSHLSTPALFWQATLDPASRCWGRYRRRCPTRGFFGPGSGRGSRCSLTCDTTPALRSL